MPPPILVLPLTLSEHGVAFTAGPTGLRLGLDVARPGHAHVGSGLSVSELASSSIRYVRYLPIAFGQKREVRLIM